VSRVRGDHTALGGAQPVDRHIRQRDDNASPSIRTSIAARLHKASREQ
jgi:hypothetical protein